jgi:hypothetical protein
LSGIGQWAAVRTVAPSLGIELTPVNVIDMGEIERSVAAFARAPNWERKDTDKERDPYADIIGTCCHQPFFPR